MANEPAGLLVDTQLLLWWAAMPEQRPEPARSRLASTECPLFFSLASLWEVAIKASLGRQDFQVNPSALRMGLLREGFQELP
ncbi:MAG: PIN domain nuclease, partial [Cyanobium sp.]